VFVDVFDALFEIAELFFQRLEKSVQTVAVGFGRKRGRVELL
jgi:hypothetical protein